MSLLYRILLFLAGALPSFSTLASPSVYPTGTTRYAPDRAYNSFILFTGGDHVARLIDMNGRTVHQWNDAGYHSTLIDPAVNGGKRGNLLVTLSTVSGEGTDLIPGLAGRRIAKTVGELDWNGNQVWSFGDQAPGGAALQHHDWARLDNGHTLLLANQARSIEGFKLARLLDDVIYEIDSQGKIIWHWKAAEHIDEFGFTPEQLKLVRATDNPDYLHLNNLKVVGANRWFDAGDTRFAPENLIIDSRNANFIAIIDKHTGRIVWRLGPNYPAIATGPQGRKTPRPVDQIAGQHDAHIIAKGLPGAGNLLVFDNQGPSGYPSVPLPITGGSRVLEIDPIKRQIVWQYSGKASGAPGWSFRSTHISAARRLPNGNTFIDEGQSGRLFQITPDGDIVWEYVNPYARIGEDALTGRKCTGQPIPDTFFREFS